MKINAQNTKIMTKINETVQATMDNKEFEQVNSFVCLGSIFNQDSGCTDAMKTR